MTSDEFMAIVDAEKYNTYIFSPVPEDLLEEVVIPPATEEEIAHAEQEIGVRLPQDYVFFLQRFGGDIFGYVEIFSVKSNSKSYVLWDQPPVTGERNFVAFSADGWGNYYGFRVVDGVCDSKVSFWNHELDGDIRETEYSDIFEFIVDTGLSNPADKFDSICMR